MSTAAEQLKILADIDKMCAEKRQALSGVATETETMISFLTEVWGVGVDHPAKTIKMLNEVATKIDDCDKALFLAQITATHAATVLKQASGLT